MCIYIYTSIYIYIYTYIHIYICIYIYVCVFQSSTPHPGARHGSRRPPCGVSRLDGWVEDIMSKEVTCTVYPRDNCA